MPQPHVCALASTIKSGVMAEGGADKEGIYERRFDAMFAMFDGIGTPHPFVVKQNIMVVVKNRLARPIAPMH